MAKQESTHALSSLPLLVAVMFIAGGVVVTRLPLGSARPEPPEGLEPPTIDADLVRGRVWQDAFKVAQEHERAAHGKDDAKKTECRSDHCVNQVEAELSEALKDPPPERPDRPPVAQILTIMVRHTDSDEDYERRLRNRHAVHMALSAAGMEPEETRHLRYFRLGSDDGWTPAAKPLVVPFETFRRDKLYPEVTGAARERRPKKLIVVWFPEGALGEAPLTGLARLKKLFMGEDYQEYLGKKVAEDWPRLRLDVIGPSRSKMLRAMLEELAERRREELGAMLEELAERRREELGAEKTSKVQAEKDEVQWAILDRLTIFSPWSTASPALLTRSLCSDPNVVDPNWRDVDSVTGLAEMFDLVRSRFASAGIEFVRMIGTDDLLAMQVIEELRRRRVYVAAEGADGESDHVALVCERDTFYGKTFPLAFMGMVKCMREGRGRFDWGAYARCLHEGQASDREGVPGNVHAYSYYSGIDGRLPGEPWGEKAGESKERRPPEPVWTIRKGLELPTGRGRLDYGRRLAHELRQHYLRREGHELKAIGVVGSDVYDKLTLLRALREEFGDVTLFTTDLDARLLYHKQLNWTRNVIVASNYGLELSGEYQRRLTDCERGAGESFAEERTPPRFAPFRDNYQTALFLACRSALGLQAHVGTGRASFRGLDPGVLAEALSHPRIFEIGRGQAVDLSVPQAGSAVDVHPPRPRHPGLLALFGRHIWLLASLAVGVVLLWPVGRGMLPLLSRLELRAHERMMTWRSYLKPYWLILLLGGIATIILTLVIIEDHYGMEGEPFSLTAGVSAWPGILIFAAALLLSLFFIKLSTMMLRANELRIIDEFRVGDRRKAETRKPLLKRGLDYVLDILKRAEVTSAEASAGDAGTSASRGHPDAGNALKLWEDNVNRWRFADRILWPLLWFCGLWLFPLFLVVGLGRPHHPCRGAWCYWTYGVTAGLCMLSFLVLLLLIAAEIRRRLNVINPIINEFTTWAIPDFDTEKHEEVAEWLDVRFIARITEGAGDLVYFPSVILLLLIAARLPYFDQWGFPPLLFIIYTIPTAYILGLMATLQLAARRGRATALYHLQQQLNEVSIGRGLIRVKRRERNDAEATDQETGPPPRRLPPPARRAKQERIERMIAEIEELREGAFRPFAENPIVHALLIPSGGAGLLAVLTYLLPT